MRRRRRRAAWSARPAAQVPDEARKQLIEVLGGAFIVFRDHGNLNVFMVPAS